MIPEKKLPPVKKLFCTCQHPFQDQQHGPNIRVHNLARGKGQSVPTGYVCTVCGIKKGLS